MRLGAFFPLVLLMGVYFCHSCVPDSSVDTVSRGELGSSEDGDWCTSARSSALLILLTTSQHHWCFEIVSVVVMGFQMQSD